ncbi:ER membrane protein complex subunit 3-like [Agrilus planipennis]|uniref:ER membrane protein complex subunit 3 n=1 Tax=Agrilus planipennis TaxID=224129 RepID=A0A1W4X3P1_AGRPL|nr:ER membrane protein complex subunit 3 [Agrilus planipennis]XP_025835732.1 ER membrane protein complex subunit 3-like [Agrilus planipennis]
MTSDLVVDSQIRGWVFLPIVVITFLVGILRHYISILFISQKKAEPQQLQDSQIIMRSRILRENGKYIPKSSFSSRRQFFNVEEGGYLTQKRAPVNQNMMTDPTMITDMLKGNITNVLPMIIIGGWINWMLSGFITTKVPFPLTLRFKPMLQRGIEQMHLDASWVSSASWYFLNVFGLRSIYTLVLGENNGADQSRHMQEQMSGAAVAMPTDSKVAFKSEWEALELAEHQWALHDIEQLVIQKPM